MASPPGDARVLSGGPSSARLSCVAGWGKQASQSSALQTTTNPFFLNPNPTGGASHSQRTTMKLTILTCLCSGALVLTGFGQSPAPSPSVSSTAVASASAGANISPAVSATPEDEDSIEQS